MKRTKLSLLIFLIFGCLQVYSQTIEDVNTIDKAYQSCLDKGVQMINCSIVYYTQLNDLLNTTNKTLWDKSEPGSHFGLEMGQREWLEKKAIYFEMVEEEFGGDNHYDRGMIVTDKKANFVRERILELLYELKFLEKK